ncbi:TonB-dependent receptor [Alteromonas sp. a30]|uniref:TonB-dependent receptor n=1 Tax=Alteromonas sp. a30 TaxID=2730917 RepID=UPI00227E3C81|nr:TonB-dependent receptor [Alteromonas sp. a30]MCY7297330.1 TonB-dependent receptor [Alteromonas sp. a30]
MNKAKNRLQLIGVLGLIGTNTLMATCDAASLLKSSLKPLQHGASHERKVDFNIQPQRVHEALIQFAKQANLTIVFPIHRVENTSTGLLHGRYSVQEAINILLSHTNLKAKISDNGRITLRVIKEIDEGLFFDKVEGLLKASEEALVTRSAQQEAAKIEQITVRGLRASVRQSVYIKRESDSVVDAIQALDIGKFPDQNLAESLQRVSGVSIDRAEGEGQFVTVRGFGPQFNKVLINGRQMATDNQGREFSFDTIASEMVSGVKIYKTTNATQQSGGIGSTINIETAKPLAHHDARFVGSVKQQYDSNSHAFSPQYAALISNSFFQHRLGVLASFSQQKREARIDEAQIDGWLLNTAVPPSELTNSAQNLFVPRNYDQRVRFDERTRRGGTVVLQYRPDDQLDMTFDYLQTEFDVKTEATSMGHWFTSSNLESVLADENGTAVAFEQNVGHATDFHARTFDRPATLSASGINVNWQATPSLDVELDWSLSEAYLRDKNGAANALSLIGFLNRSEFDHTAGNILPSISGFQAVEFDAASGNHYLDPHNGRAHVMLRRGWNIRDKVEQLRVAASLDIAQSSLFGGLLAGVVELTQLDFGVRLAQQNKRNERRDNEANARHCAFCGYFSEPDIPNDFQSVFLAGEGFLAGISGHENIPNIWLRHDGEQLFRYLEQVGDVDLDAVTRGNSFDLQEQTLASYIDLVFNRTFSHSDLSGHLGVRYEQTNTRMTGFNERLLDLVILDQTELGQVTGTSIAVENRHHYYNWLPSLSVKLEIGDDWVARGAISKSITRPTIMQLSPSIALNTTRQGGDLRASAGNPYLQPFESRNLDVSLEYYYGHDSYVSLGYFLKDVKNFIIQTLEPFTFDGVKDPSTGSDPNAADPQDELAIFDLTRPKNGERARVDGVELSLLHTFGQSGFGVIANMTLVDSNAELDRADVNETFALTGLSHSENMVLYYEKDAWQWRVAYNHRDGFLQSLAQSQSAEPTFVAAYQQWDMSVSYQLNDNISVFVEGINLTDEDVWKHGRYRNQLLRVQDTGSRYTLGLRGHF